MTTIAAVAGMLFAGYSAFVLYQSQRAKIVAEFVSETLRAGIPGENEWDAPTDDPNTADKLTIYAQVRNASEARLLILHWNFSDIPLSETRSRTIGREVAIGGKEDVKAVIAPDWKVLQQRLGTSERLDLRISVIIESKSLVALRTSRAARISISSHTIKRNAAILTCAG